MSGAAGQSWRLSAPPPPHRRCSASSSTWLVAPTGGSRTTPLCLHPEGGRSPQGKKRRSVPLVCTCDHTFTCVSPAHGSAGPGPGRCQDALRALPLNPSPNRQVTHSLHGRQVAEDHVHGVNRVGADGLLQVCRLSSSVSSQDVVKQVPADQRHELDGDLEGAVLPPVPRQRHVHINLRTRAG